MEVGNMGREMGACSGCRATRKAGRLPRAVRPGWHAASTESESSVASVAFASSTVLSPVSCNLESELHISTALESPGRLRLKSTLIRSGPRRSCTILDVPLPLRSAAKGEAGRVVLAFEHDPSHSVSWSEVSPVDPVLTGLVLRY